MCIRDSNSTLGWTWADPVAALVIAAVALKEGVEAWRGDACCTPASALIAGDQNEKDGDGCGADCACCAHSACLQYRRTGW